jgi:8-oxo-dGTP pyrophosphatase MutT (NUDIX family)
MLLKIYLGRLSRWTARHSWPLAFGIILLAFDIAGLSPGGHPVLLLGGLLAIGYGIVEIATKGMKDVRELRRIYDRPHVSTTLSAPYELPYDSWQQLTLHSLRAVTSAEVNERLSAGAPIATEREARLWKPGGKREEVRRLLRLRLDVDEEKIRLSEDLLPGSGSVRLQRTKYSAFLVTNRLGSVELREQGNTRPRLDEQDLLTAGRIPRLSRSSASNHLGVDVLAVTDDGRILITRQSPKNMLSPGLLAPSGSGSVDWADFTAGDDLGTVLRRAMRREMCEELGLATSAVPDLDSVRLLGYARLTNLGGKPQFFGVVRTGDIHGRVRGGERRYISDHLTIDFEPERGIAEVLRALDSFENEHRDELSFPLFLNLQMFRQWLTKGGQAAQWLAGARPGP